MTDDVSPNHFDRGRIFYPLVVTYVTQLFGFKELAVRGVPGVQISVSLEATRQAPGSQRWIDGQHDLENLNKVRGPLELKCVTSTEPVRADPDEMARELVANIHYLSEYQMSAAATLCMSAYEYAKERAATTDAPAWEFLRHCRNAAAHGGSFHFVGDEPRRAATWRGLSITKELGATPLVLQPDGRGLLGPGDPIRLLWDIEQAFPKLEVSFREAT